MVERARWIKPKVQYIDRKCTLCNDNNISFMIFIKVVMKDDDSTM